MPTEVLESLDEETLQIFTTDVKLDDISSKTIYVKFTENEDGTIKTENYAENEYLKQRAFEIYQNVTSADWMKIHLVLSPKSDGKTAEASGAFTWLTYPSLRMKNVVGIVIQNGVVTNGTATGFYTYTTSQGATTTNWTSGFNYFLGGVTKVQNLAKPDYPVNSDYMFIKFQFTKSNEPAEALYGTYGHQVLTINISNPVLNYQEIMVN